MMIIKACINNVPALSLIGAIQFVPSGLTKTTIPYALLNYRISRPLVFFFLAATFLSLCESGNVFAGDSIRPISAMVGKVGFGNSEASFVSVGDNVALAIDPALIVKGDTLGVYGAENNEADENRALKLFGSLVVTSNSNEPPMGKLTNASREIYGKTYLAFDLTAKEQLNRYIPFLQSMADLYLSKPGRRPVKVALIDVVNPFGDRTKAGDVIFDDLQRAICSRTQFRCISREKLAEYFWRNGVKTSRNIDASIERGLRESLNVDVIVTGHLNKTVSGTDLILMAVNASHDLEPRRMWRRFKFDDDEFKLGNSFFNTVTLPFKKTERARLIIKRSSADTVDGMTVEYFSHEDLSEWVGMTGAGTQTAVAGDFFVLVDDRPYPMDIGGIFFDDEIPAGKHRVAFGYFPEIRQKDGNVVRANNAVQTEITIELSEGEAFDLVVTGVIEKGYGLLIGDLNAK